MTMALIKVITTILVMTCLLLFLLLIETKTLYERKLYECEQVLELNGYGVNDDYDDRR